MNFLHMVVDRFWTRVLLGKTFINIHGETFECEVIDCGRTYGGTGTVIQIKDKETKKVLVDCSSFNIYGGPDMYQIEGASLDGKGEATLFLQYSFEDYEKEFGENDEDEEDYPY